MQFPFETDVSTLSELEAVATRLAESCEGDECITLQGTLGAGKTAFAQYFIRHLVGAETDVVSPTFLLVQDYDITLQNAAPARLFHLDLYRLKDESELQELGLEEMLNDGITLIEWPEIAARLLPQQHIALRFEVNGDTRVLRGEKI